MADKKLNEVTKVTDMAYVPVIMSDGSIGQIAKADLASVVAGLIGNANYSKTGLMPLGYAYTSGTRTMAKDEVYILGGVEGLFLFQDIASYSHWHVMFKAKGVLLDLSNKAFGYLKLSTEGNNLVITNVAGGTARQFTIIYQNISLFS